MLSSSFIWFFLFSSYNHTRRRPVRHAERSDGDVANRAPPGWDREWRETRGSSFIPYVACLTTSCHSLTPYHSLGSCRFVSSPSIHLTKWTEWVKWGGGGWGWRGEWWAEEGWAGPRHLLPPLTLVVLGSSSPYVHPFARSLAGTVHLRLPHSVAGKALRGRMTVRRRHETDRW